MNWENVEINIEMNTDDIEYTPLLQLDTSLVSVYIWKKPKISIEALETQPYEFDGSIPMVFIQMGWLEFIVTNKWLYKKVYTRKYGYCPQGLESEDTEYPNN